MFMLFGKNKIQEIEEDIVREISALTNTAYILPFEFSKPERKGGSIYRVTTNVIRAGNAYYPPEIFMCLSNIWEKPVLVLEPKYDSLGNCFILPDDGGWAFGFECQDESVTNYHDYIEKIAFDIDVRKGTYTLVDEKLTKKQKSKQSQPGDN